MSTRGLRSYIVIINGFVSIGNLEKALHYFSLLKKQFNSLRHFPDAFIYNLMSLIGKEKGFDGLLQFFTENFNSVLGETEGVIGNRVNARKRDYVSLLNIASHLKIDEEFVDKIEEAVGNPGKCSFKEREMLIAVYVSCLLV